MAFVLIHSQSNFIFLLCVLRFKVEICYPLRNLQNSWKIFNMLLCILFILTNIYNKHHRWLLSCGLPCRFFGFTIMKKHASYETHIES